MQIKTTKKILTCPIVKNKKRMMTYSDVKLWENMHSPCWWAREGNLGGAPQNYQYHYSLMQQSHF
jgi:hypothetical protein